MQQSGQDLSNSSSGAKTPPIEHVVVCSKDSTGRPTAWFCVYCKLLIEAKKIPVHGAGTRQIGGWLKKQAHRIEYRDGKPIRHIHCPVRFGDSQRNKSSMKSYFRHTPREGSLDEVVGRDKLQLVQQGHGLPAPGIDMLGRGILVQEDCMEMDGRQLQPLLKSKIIDHTVLFNYDKGQRVPLLYETSRLYVPSGVLADTVNIKQEAKLKSGDSRSATKIGSEGLGVNIGLDGGISTSLGGEIKRLTDLSKGSITINGVATYEKCRLSVDSDKLTNESINKKFKEVLSENWQSYLRSSISSSDPRASLEEKFGRRFIKSLTIGGKLEFSINVGHKDAAKSIDYATGGLQMVPEEGDLNIGFKRKGKKSRGGLSYNCSVTTHGGRAWNIMLTDKTLEEILEGIEKWKDSIERYENLQPVSAVLGNFKELLE